MARGTAAGDIALPTCQARICDIWVRQKVVKQKLEMCVR